jgi:hypothetical protein
MPTPDLGCRTNSTKINTTTMQGNNRTTPRGIEMLELPLNRNGRRKNANLDVTFVFSLTSSMKGRLGDEGMCFRTLWMNPMDAAVFVVASWAKSIKGFNGESCRRKSLLEVSNGREYYNMYSEPRE